jgi:hypothetical protein
MRKSTRILVAILGAACWWGWSAAHAEERPAEYQKAIDRGLAWLAKQQAQDGHWEANGGQYPTAITALAGMAFLMEGSTTTQGRYQDILRRATDHLVQRAQANGLIGNTNNPLEQRRYMYGHGFGMLFLASVFGEEEDAQQRRKLEDILARAVVYTGKAQCSQGGWGYLARGMAQENDDRDEGSVTITQLQAIRAARNVGIPVPRKIIDDARKYLEKCTNPNGSVRYALGRQDERPALTAAAVACGFSMGEYDNDLVKKWLAYCKKNVPALGSGGNVGGRMGHDEYTHYYLAQCIYVLGEDGFAKLFPESREDDRYSWLKYRKATCDYLVRNQRDDGSWGGIQGSWMSSIGPVYVTSLYLAILQLDGAVLPIYQR